MCQVCVETVRLSGSVFCQATELCWTRQICISVQVTNYEVIRDDEKIVVDIKKV